MIIALDCEFIAYNFFQRLSRVFEEEFFVVLAFGKATLGL